MARRWRQRKEGNTRTLRTVTVGPLSQSSLVGLRLRDYDNSGGNIASRHRWTDGIGLAECSHFVLVQDGKEVAPAEGRKYSYSADGISGPTISVITSRVDAKRL